MYNCLGSCCCPICIKGEKGDKGEKGEKGEQGERGERGEQGERGERGEQGLQGKSENVSMAYGGLYNYGSQLVLPTVLNNFYQIRLDTPMPSRDVTVNTNNTLTIVTDGIYELHYNFLFSANMIINIFATARKNGAVILQSRGAQTLAFDTTNGSYDARVSVSTIVELRAGDVIDTAFAVINSMPSSPPPLEVLISGNANATMTVKLLDVI